MTTLREEFWPSLYGTRLRSQKHGLCRVRHLYPTKLSAIVGDKPIGALADVWFRIVDGQVLEWTSDVEVEVLQMTDLRTAAQQALDSINELFTAEQSEGGERSGHIRTPATREHLVHIAQARKALHESCGALRAALAQQAESVQPGAWVASKDGRVIYDDSSTDDSLLRVSGDFENDEQRISYAKQIVDKLNAAPPQRTMVPLTEEEIMHIGMTHQSLRQVVRAVERAHGIKEN